jgi:hypothetical protein
MGEFGVHRADVQGEMIVVDGRCYRGPLRRGDVFRVLRPGDMVVRLAVERIVAYKRELDEIDEGLTARLSLRGDGGEFLMQGTILSTE